MVKQFENGRIEAPCKRIDQIYSVRMGSLRLYENGQYATASTNATAVSFSNPNILRVFTILLHFPFTTFLCFA